MVIGLILALLFFIGLPIIIIYTRVHKQFGQHPSTVHKEQYASSKQWNGKKFANQSVTKMSLSFQHIPGLIRENMGNRKVKTPEQPLPLIPFDVDSWNNLPEQAKYVWFGHSAVLLQLNGKNILIDPMLGSDTSPIAPFPTKRFSQNTLEIIDQLPEIDLILLTHDHYDHLDLASIQKLKEKTRLFYVALGVDRHLISWGISPDKISVFDWWDSALFEGIDITFTPSRHFSGRGILDREKSLWGGWVLKTLHQAIYWTGDSGYDQHFKTVGEQLGPFDIVFVECGQYHKLWSVIHMMPEESVQAVEDSQAKMSVPVHWGAFSLAPHAWKNPIERFVKAAQQQNVPFQTPQLGEIMHIGKQASTSFWWENYN